MALENQISVVFTDAEQTEINTHVNALLTIFRSKGISLQPKQRQQYGRVKYEKEVFIDNAKTEMDNNPDKVPNYVDTEELDRDYSTHKFLNPVIASIEQVRDMAMDINLLLGYDLDNTALMFYRNIKVAAQNNDPGARTIYEKLRVQFPGNGGGKKDPLTP